MRVIGICGKAGAGKNTVAGMLAAELSGMGHTVVIHAYANALKEDAREMLGYEGVKDAFWRSVLQKLGEHKRQKWPDYWVRRLFDTYMPGGEGTFRPAFLIIPDVRYHNELDPIIGSGGGRTFIAEANCDWPVGVLWRVSGRGGLEGANGAHASETELDAWLATAPGAVRCDIWNTGTLDELMNTVRAAVKSDMHLAPIGG